MSAILEKEILQLEAILQYHEDIDPLYIPRELAKQRHYTFFVHERIEQSLDQLYQKYVFSWLKYDRPSVFEDATQMFKLIPILSVISFRQKINKYKELKLITEEMRKKFEKINQYRDWFAHPLGYRTKLQKLAEDRNMQKNLLIVLTEGLDLLNLHFKEKEEIF